MVVAAVRETLREEPYASRIRFSVHGFQSPEGRKAVALYPFGYTEHGFVLLDRTGEMLSCRPSHFYGREEIQGDFDKALGIARPATRRR